MADIHQITQHGYIVLADNETMIHWNGSSSFQVWYPSSQGGSAFRQWTQIDFFTYEVQNAAEAKMAARQYFNEQREASIIESQ